MSYQEIYEQGKTAGYNDYRQAVIHTTEILSRKKTTIGLWDG